MVISESQIWLEAAAKIYECIRKLISEANFSEFNIIMLHNIYLVTSLAYYRFDESYIPDHLFDQLCKYLLDNFDVAERVVRNPSETLCKHRLSAGTGFDLKYSPAIFNIYQHFSRLASNVTPVHFKKRPESLIQKSKTFF